jgi:hypothetical protein
MSGVAFALFAAVSVGGGIACLCVRSHARATVALCASLAGTAGLLLLAGADGTALAHAALQSGVGLALFLVGALAAPAPGEQRSGRSAVLALGAALAVAAFLAWRCRAAFAAADLGEPAAGEDKGLGLALVDPARHSIAFALLALLAGAALAAAGEALARRAEGER